MLGAESDQHPGQDPGAHDDERDEARERSRSLDQGSLADPTQGQDRDRHDDHGDILDDAPAEHRPFRLEVGRPSAAAGHVHDHDARRRGKPEPDQGGPDRRQADREQDGHRDRDRDRHLERREEQDRALLVAQSEQVDLDPNLEQQERDPDVGQELDLVPIGDVAGREARHGKPDQQVSDDRRQADPSRDPTGAGRDQQHDRDVEDQRSRALHRPAVSRSWSCRRGTRTRTWSTRGARPDRSRRPRPAG